MSVMYCTPADITDVARLDHIGADKDAGLTQIISAVSQRLDQWHNLPEGGFAVSADSTRYYPYSAIERGRLHLDMSCLSVTTLTNGDGVVLPPNAYRLHPRNDTRKWFIDLLDGYAWNYTTDGEIAVTGKFGYSLIVPDNVMEACAMWSAYLFKRYQAALQDATANYDLGQIIYSEAIPKQVLALLRGRGPSL